MSGKPTETTTTILDQLQKSPREYITLHIAGSRYLVSSATVKLMTWNAIPDFLKDEHSDEAKKMSTLRIALKALIRPALPMILSKTWGIDVAITPGLNILSWLPKYFTHYFIAFLASKEWEVHVQPIDESIYKIVAISPYSNDSGDIERLATTATGDSQPVQRGTESNAHRQADSDVIRRSMGNCGDEEIRQEHIL